MARRKSSDDFNSWISVVLFYKIVHFTEAMLADVNEHASSHSERENFLKEDVIYPNYGKRDYKRMWKSYITSKDLCNRSRYFCIYPTCEDIGQENEDVEQYIRLAARLLPKHIKPGCITKRNR